MQKPERRTDIPPPPVVPYPISIPRRGVSKDWDGTIYVSNLPKDGDRSTGEYVEDIFSCYCYVKRIRLYVDSNGLNWNGCALIILEDVEIKDKLIRDGLYQYEHKEYRVAKIEHHKPIIWYK